MSMDVTAAGPSPASVDRSAAAPARPRKTGIEPALTEEERAQLADLKARDREVRAHEQAHRSAGGPYVRGGSFSYERGPDGNQYVVAGEVRIDSSPIAGDPEATLQKARIVRAAALAPVDPSTQDRMVAAKAGQMAADARAELARAERPSNEPGDSDDAEGGNRAALQRFTQFSADALASEGDTVDEMV